MPRNGSSSLLFATMFPQTIMSMILLTPPVVADRVVATFHLPAEAAGLYTTLSFLFIAVGTLSSAALIARVGPLRLSFLCVALGGFALALFGVGTIFSVLLATAFIGMCYGPLTPSSQQAIATQGPITNLALFLSIRQTAVPLGGIFAGIIVPPLVVHFGLEVAMLILGAAVVVSTLLTGVGLSAVRSEVRPERYIGAVGFFAPLRFMFRNRHLLRLSFASTIYGALQLTVSSLLVVFLMAELGRDIICAGAMLGISQVAAVMGRIGWGYLADRFKALQITLAVLGAGMAGACVLMGMLTPDTPNWVIGIVVLMLGGTTSGWNGVFLASLMREVTPQQAGFATSGALLFSYVGIVIGPPLFGALALLAGFSCAFLALGAVAFAGSMLCWSPGPPAASAASS